MENYLIGPWDHLTNTLPPGTVLEQYVPPELEKMAYKVMEQYEMLVFDMLLITSKPDKGGAIWRINTDRGPRSLKVLHRDPKRSLFSIGAQQYMVERGAKVPAFIPNKENTLYVEAGGKLWIVTEWIESLQQASKIDLEGAVALCYGLGEFHKHSQGYAPPLGAAKSSRLYGWSNYYEKIMAKIGWFEDIATVYRETPSSERLLSVIDEFKKQAQDIFSRFQTSPYFKMIGKGEQYWGLAHQDYGWSNGQMGPGGIWVIDLDGVAYDLPFRDLRKLITSTMDDMGYWDLNWIRGMIGAYHEANPIDQDMFELLWIDMAFPNEFYKHIKEIVFDPNLFLQHELEPILARVLATESSKWQALTELEQDKALYLPAQYSTEEIESKWEVVRKAPVRQGIKLPVGIDIPQMPWAASEKQEQGLTPVFDADFAHQQQEAIPVFDTDLDYQQQEAIPVFDTDLDYLPYTPLSNPVYLSDSDISATPARSEHFGLFTHAPLIYEPAGVPIMHPPAAVGTRELAANTVAQADNSAAAQPPANEPERIALRVPKPSRLKKKVKKVVVKTKRKTRKKQLQSRPVTKIKIVKKLKKTTVKKARQPSPVTKKKIEVKKKQAIPLKSSNKPIYKPRTQKTA
ncbi:CotS family spore coat protein [Paenibacillus periandrae]|uniref:CotS family spore coat protein n=1 Tax=Paenibacillus periandrae TaxID=1761741 RepID=UPI001F0965FB|nr:CotS family spore coat protein [Paenibacillus periandrae]